MNKPNFKDMTKPFVSVALRAYNQSKLIIKALDSIVQQEVDFPVEIFCGVDLSTDNTLSVVSEYAKHLPEHFTLKVIEHTKSMGGARNLMSVLRQCEGKYIAWLDGDDYWVDKLKTKKQIAILEADEGIGVVYTNDYIDSPYAKNLFEERERPTLKENAFMQLLIANYITSETAIFRSDLLQFVDWDEYVKYEADDWFIWLECAAHKRFIHLKEHTSAATMYRTIEGDMTIASLKYAESLLGLQKYYLNKYPHLTTTTVQDIDDHYAEQMIRAGLMLNDIRLTQEAVRIHSLPKSMKMRLYYYCLSHKMSFRLYMWYRDIKGKNKKTSLQRYFY